MSGLLEDIRIESTATSAMRCPIGRCRDELDASDQRDLDAALADASFTHVAITKVLAKRGLVNLGSVKGIAAHRKGECGCSR